MIILLDEHISCEKFYVISNIDDIKNTKSNSVVIFDYDKDLMVYCLQNNVPFAVNVKTIPEIIYSNSLNARYIFPITDTPQLIETAQKLADNYMFDSKIIARIQDSNEIEYYSLKEIDGVIFIK